MQGPREKDAPKECGKRNGAENDREGAEPREAGEKIDQHGRSGRGESRETVARSLNTA